MPFLDGVQEMGAVTPGRAEAAEGLVDALWMARCYEDVKRTLSGAYASLTDPKGELSSILPGPLTAPGKRRCSPSSTQLCTTC